MFVQYIFELRYGPQNAFVALFGHLHLLTYGLQIFRTIKHWKTPALPQTPEVAFEYWQPLFANTCIQIFVKWLNIIMFVTLDTDYSKNTTKVTILGSQTVYIGATNLKPERGSPA